MEEDTILCPHEGEDGKVCHLKLNSKFKFCPNCGGKVDQALFQQGPTQDHLAHSESTKTDTTTKGENPVTKNEESSTSGGEIIGNRDDVEETETYAEIRQNKDTKEDASTTENEETLDNEKEKNTNCKEENLKSKEDDRQDIDVDKNEGIEALDKNIAEERDIIESKEKGRESVIENVETENDQKECKKIIVGDEHEQQERLTEKSLKVENEDSEGVGESVCNEINDNDGGEGDLNEVKQKNVDSKTKEYGEKPENDNIRDNYREDIDDKDLQENPSEQTEEAEVYIWVKNETERDNKKEEQTEVNTSDNRNGEKERGQTQRYDQEVVKSDRKDKIHPNIEINKANENKEEIEKETEKEDKATEKEEEEGSEVVEHKTKNEKDETRTGYKKDHDEMNDVEENIVETNKVEGNADFDKAEEINKMGKESREEGNEEITKAIDTIKFNENEGKRGTIIRAQDKNNGREKGNGGEKGNPKNAKSEERKNEVEKIRVNDPVNKSIEKNQNGGKYQKGEKQGNAAGKGENNGNRKKETGKGTTGSKRFTDSKHESDKKTVKVCFHAFLAPSVDFKPKKDKLYVTFGPERDDWVCKNEGLMKLIACESVKKGGIAIPVYGEVELEKDLLKYGLSYKYCFERTKDGKTHPETEHFFQKYLPYRNNTRTVEMPPYVRDDCFHQYDGFIYRREKKISFTTWLKEKIGISSQNITEMLRRDGEYALKQHLPLISDVMNKQDLEPMTIINMFQEYSQVLRGGVKDHFLSSQTQYEASYWQTFIIEDHLGYTIEKLESEANKLDVNGKLLKALLLVNLLADLKIEAMYLQPKCREIISHSFLIFPEIEWNNCPQLDFLNNCMDQSMRKSIKDGLVLFLKNTAWATVDEAYRNPAWILCLPIIHFLDGSLQPFKELDFANFRDKENDWWLMKEFEREKEDLKYRAWTSSPLDVMNLIKPMFKLDTKTQRGFMACLTPVMLEDVMREETIVLEIKLATLQHYIETVYTYKEMEYILNCVKIVNESLKDHITYFTNVDKREWDAVDKKFKIQQERCYALLAIGLKQGHLIVDKRELITLFHCSLLSTSLLEMLSYESNELKTLLKIPTFEIDYVLLPLQKDITAYDYALSVLKYTKSNVLTEEWNKRCILHAKKMVDTVDTRTLLDIYSRFMTELQNDSLRQMVQHAVMASIDNMKESYFTSCQWIWPSDNYLVSRFFSQMWKSYSNLRSYDILRKILSSPLYPKCVEACLLQSEIFQMMEPEAKDNLERSLSIMRTICVELYQHHVSIEVLYLLISKKEMFLAVTDLFEKHQSECLPIMSSAYKNLLLCREKDLKTLNEVMTTVETLRFFFEEIREMGCSFEIKEIDEDTLENWKTLQIKDVCCIPEEFVSEGQYQPKITLFEELLTKMESLIKNILFFNESKTFHKILKMIAKGKNDMHKMGSIDLMQHILKPTKDTWCDLCIKMKDGSISIRETEKYRFYELSTDELKSELVAMNRGVKDPWIKQRADQLQRFKMFSNTRSVSNLLLKVKERYNIQGSFDNLELIANSETNRDISLNGLKMGIEKFNAALQEINDEQKRSIESFRKSSDLVKWLQTALPGGYKDLKIYADLALLSVEGDEQVGRVTNLHSATLGYSSVIYGDIHGENEMINAWKEVWENLDKDTFLPGKLEKSNQYLVWFKEIKESHGSVEVTSLKQVDAIKDRGIFKVGYPGDGVKRKHQLELEDVIWLHVPAVKPEDEFLDETIKDSSNDYNRNEDEEEEQKKLKKTFELGKKRNEGVREYALGEMADLQSRLMLVTGKADAGRESIERFTSIFDNVTRLGKVFIQLHASGCILFKHWRFEFHCNPNAGCSVMIRTHEQSVVKGTNIQYDSEDSKATQSNVNDYIRRIADFMERCYEEWVRYINEKRKCFYPLNFYTVDQMVLLQEEIARYRNRKEVSRFLCPLLSLIRSNCMLAPDLEGALINVQETLITSEQTSDLKNEADKTSHEEAIRQFLIATEESGISRKHALRAIQSQEFKIEDTDEGLLWCLSHAEHGDDEGVEENSSGKKDDSKNTTISDMLKECFDVLEENLRQQEITKVVSNLEMTWKKFLNCASSSATDFLSIDHLGMILDELYQKETFILQRTLIDPLKRGTPNLIVCSQSEVIPMLLTLFMVDEHLPLPSRNEVFLCTRNSTKEEVDIFFRRAFFQRESDPNERLFCLMNADKLQYDVSEQSLKDVTEYIKSAKKAYKLVIICSSENEYKSPMISALDKYRTPNISVQSIRNIQEYLKKKYTPDNVQETATEIDLLKNCVRTVQSERAGMGKTLYKTRLSENLSDKYPNGTVNGFPLSITIPLSQKEIQISEVSNKLLECTLPEDASYPRIFHIDIASGVELFVGDMLFNILILGSLVDESGYVFQRSEKDLFIIETTNPQENLKNTAHVSSLQLINILPCVRCISPMEVLQNQDADMEIEETIIGFDETNFQSDEWQRPYHYLMNFERKCNDIPVFEKTGKTDSNNQCLSVLIQHCCIRNPSWAELRNFVQFLNTQLEDFEKSVYCSEVMKEDLPGFPIFVLRFLIQMSKDFSTRSLEMSEGKTSDNLENDAEKDSSKAENEPSSSEMDDDIKQFQMRRKWETSAHPYLFFNPDQHTMTFIGFNINKFDRNLVDQQTGVLLEENILSKQLWGALQRNNVPLQESFDDLTRDEKIQRLCRVVGNDIPQDPDETYELTTDNVKKMMAIYMRFRCSIPVIIMGETGCGKTCLIKFLCALQCPAGVEMNTMTLMKVHGGTTKKHIVEKVRQAENLAEFNCKKFGDHIITVLFFDEANTTSAVGCIKEIMCDGTIDGQPLTLNTNLKLVAACNPYRKHSNEMIKRLERAGLGYHVNPDQTHDKLGSIPMRHLVYRVQPLPQSLLPLVWDFGQLDTNVEKLYIIQMVQRCVKDGTLPIINRATISILSNILAASQEFMRRQKDECSFVSLRDVERTLRVFGWMYNQIEQFYAINKMNSDEDDEDETTEQETNISHEVKLTKALLLALGVCYHSSLKSRDDYRQTITRYFMPPLELSVGAAEMEQEIKMCQMAFLKNLKLNDNIAKNLALRENFFMMAVCVELRIPLFLVGKPGSSKSLSKTILDHNMQGRDSESELFKSFKQVQLISFQCSPLATADGILKTFKQASFFQKSKDLNRFVSVVVLDEVGLAEDSPRMPLKALHPLLEDGCPDDEEYEEYKKVSFIGISNWALDPAKMNRGILVQREVPDEEDLVESARGICEQGHIYPHISSLVPRLAKAYKHVFDLACSNDALFGLPSGKSLETSMRAREFFGLRDFYSLVKMICAIALEKSGKPTEQELITAIKRNFGGLEGLDPVQEFGKFLHPLAHQTQGVRSDMNLLRECLLNEENKTESRYILLLTENFGALNLLDQLMAHNKSTPQTIFGSSFPRDQEYIEICRNINRIKVFMETGETVILLNLENLYESLYDALNQYYMESGPDRYVDLGLGTHRVKCKVDKKFRLVVVAEKRVVYREFPIPLINRMEKHFLTMEGMLSNIQLELSEDLDTWARDFASISDSESEDDARIEEVFIGYNKDTAAGVILKAWNSCKTVDNNDNNDEIEHEEENNDEDDDDAFKKRVMDTAKEILLWGCTPDSVLRLAKSDLQMYANEYTEIYFQSQCHESLCEFLQYRKSHHDFGGSFIQITTHSKLMSDADRQLMESQLPFLAGKVSLLSLQAFDTEQQFSCQIREMSQKGKEMLLVQCNTGDENSKLVECARHCIQREVKSKKLAVCVLFLVHLSRVSKSFFSGFQTGIWTSVHIDELRSTAFPRIEVLMTKSVSSILEESLYQNDCDAEDTEEEINTPVMSKLMPVNLKDILLNCVHPALAQLVEQDEDQSRSIYRIKCIFNELNKTTQLTKGQFDHGIMKHIVTMLSRQNTESELYKASWIKNEAARSVNVNKTGTLRASCQKIMEEIVTPVLAKIVAFLDTNKNLSTLESPDSKISWIKSLWLGIVSKIDETQLGKIKDPDVKNTGLGHRFASTFPFSWLIYETVERLINLTSENAIGKTAELLFIESDMGEIIMRELPLKDTKEATLMYIMDFVHMSHNALCSEEDKMVCEFLHTCLEEHIAGKENHFVNRVFCIHRTFKHIKVKLETFSEVASFVSPDDGQFYQGLRQNIKELDIAAVRYLLDSMEPNELCIDKPEGQTQWIQNVQKYRPIVERLIQEYPDTTPVRQKLISLIKVKWSKIVVLKLFIQNLCINSTREKLMAQTCKILWKILGDNSNFKEMASMTKLETFLQASNMKAMTEFLGKFGKCANCEKNFDSSPPIVLPCEHRLCREDCFSMIKQMKEEKKCPVDKCSKPIPESFDENETPENQKKQMELFMGYQEKCNRFYMQVVSQLCFENSTAPSDDVMKHLLQLVIHKKEISKLNTTIIRTRKMTIFETVVDTTPVFRSFLLQLLIRTNEKIVLQHLANFLREADEVFEQSENRSHELELCLMLIQCIEDSFLGQLTNFHQDREEEKSFLKTLLSNLLESMQSNSSVIEKIQNIAKTRFCLQMSAKFVKEFYTDKSEPNSDGYDEIFQMTSNLCDISCHIRGFLLIYVCRSYGVDMYQTLRRSDAQWLFSSERSEETEIQRCPDYCVVLGDTYIKSRDDIAQSMLLQDERFKFKFTERSPSAQICFLLAVIKEIKINSFGKDVAIPEHFVVGLKREVPRKDLQIIMMFLNNVLEDSFEKFGKQMQIEFHHDIRGQGMVILILHFLMVLKSLKPNEIMQPLILMTANPIGLKGSFLPTMPQENLSEEIRHELQRMEELANRSYHSVTWYRCPNGHPYAVGDCGNPTQKGKCYHCNADIGGESELNADNIRDSGTDFSQPGHILGSPSERSTQAISERNLSPSSNTLLRVLIHMAMFIGANEHIEDVCKLISPAIPTATVPDFLWDHINKDIDTLRIALGRSLDDVLMFLHSIIHLFVENEESYAGVLIKEPLQSKYDWSTKEGRSLWETDFDMKYLSRKIQERQEFFDHCEDILCNDESIGSDPVLQNVFMKTVNSDSEFSISNIENSSCVWQQRTKVSFDHFIQEFYALKEKSKMTLNGSFLVLDKFLQQEPSLSLVRHVPNILHMQKILIAKYGKKVTREEAESINLQDCLEDFENDSVRRQTVSKGMSSFCYVWNKVRHSLLLIHGENEELRKLLRRDIKEDTVSVRVVLRDTKGIGACSEILLEFLIGTQNEFLRTCGSKIAPRMTESRIVAIKDWAPIDFISFQRDQDIFPIILANCNYTYIQDESTKLEYDFENIQAVLLDRFLYGKPVIDTSMGFPAVGYKAETTTSEKISVLMIKIPQKAINVAVQSQIAEEFTDLPELYETISNIDIVVNFLLSGSFSEDVLLNSYMADTLQMKPLPSPKAALCCKLSHVQSLWFLLTHEKIKRLNESEKEAFGSINDSIREALSDETALELDSYLNDFSLEKLKELMEQLMEFIIFSLNCGEGDRASFQHSLSECLMVHIDVPVYPEESLRFLRTDDVQRLPNNIRTANAVEVWKMIHRTLRSRN